MAEGIGAGPGVEDRVAESPKRSWTASVRVYRVGSPSITSSKEQLIGLGGAMANAVP